MFKIMFFTIFSTLFILSGCQEKEDLIVTQMDQIDFRLVTMDENETEAIEFEVDENFILALKVINNSGKELDLKSDSLVCNLLQNEDFLFVKKKSENYNVDSSFKSIGRPYSFPTYCLTINLPYNNQIIRNGETILVGASWHNNPYNDDLPPGKYFTEFILTLSIEDHSKTWKLRADFEVK